MDHTEGEFPCSDCERNKRQHCIYTDEINWDWSTDEVCPGFIRDEVKKS